MTTEVDRRLALLSPRAFVNDYCWIRPATGGQAVPFHLWPAQVEAIDAIHLHRMVIFLKARQLGMSWLALAYGLRHTALNRGRTLLVLNRGQREARELLQRVRFMWDRLPEWLQPRLTTDNADMLEFGDLDSRIISLPTTVTAGRSMTATMVILDEWAFLRWAEELWNSLEPTLAAGGKLVGISTANGYHNQYARIWRGAVDGRSGIYPLFLPWRSHPDRDDAWYEARQRTYADAAIRGTGLRELHREYPATPEEAFESTGMEVFGDEWSRQDHVISSEAVPHGSHIWPSSRGIDFGYHHSPCLWMRVEQERRVIVYHELAAEKMTTVELGQAIAAHDSELGLTTSKVPAGVDPAGNAQTSVGVPDVMALKRAGIKSKWGRVKPEDRVRLIKQLLREGRLYIHSSCVRTIEALERAQWDMDSNQHPKETYEKDGLYDHYLDALGYNLIVLFPPKLKAASTSQRSYSKAHEYRDSDFSKDF